MPELPPDTSDTELRLLASVADWSWRTDAELKVCDVVGNASRVLGIDAENFFGTHLLQLPQWRFLLSDVFTDVRTALDTHKPFTNAFVVSHHADGFPVLLDVNGSPIFDSEGEFSGYQGICTVIKDQSAVRIILECFDHSLAGKLGFDYFRGLVQSLSNTLNVDCVIVARYHPSNRKMLQTLAMWDNGVGHDNMTYPLRGTPCEQTLKSGVLHVSRGLRQRFEGINLLEQEQFESYLGSPLYDSDGQVIGLIVCMHRRELHHIEHLQQVCDALTARTQSELVRLQDEEQINLQKGTLDKAQLMTGFGAWRYEVDSDEVYMSDVTRLLLTGNGQPFTKLKDIIDHVLPEHVESVRAFWRSVFEMGHLQEVTFPIQTNHKGIRWIKTIADCEYGGVVDGSTRVTRVTGVIKDVSEERASQQQLRLLTAAVTQSSNAISITDLNGAIMYVNPAFTSVTGFTVADVIGASTSILKSGLTPNATYEDLWSALSCGETWRGELNNRRKDGRLYWAATLITPLRDADATVVNYLSVQEDISVRKQQEEKLLHQAHHDALTDLPNRLLAYDRLSVSVKHSQRFEHPMCLMFIDLDNFKQVNDSLGHDAGDMLLVKVARRLQSTLRDGDTVARLGGDEFLVILESANAHAAELSAKRIMRILETPMSIEGRELVTTGSIGITQYPQDGNTPEVLMRNADSAMYKAKAQGKNTFQFFTQTMDDESQKRLDTESQLRRALARNEIKLVYQPIVDVRTGAIIGAEALARWDSQLLGVVSPLEFIPLAEELGLIVDIGDHIIGQAVSQCASWQKVSPGFLMAINISPRQLRDATLKHSLKQALEFNGLDYRQVILEVTEGVLVDNVESALAYLRELTGTGLQLAIDDFGTGYSSLSYLKTFPFNRLKIDRSFISDALGSSEGMSLVKVMVDLGHQFGMAIVAEGVETQAQLEYLEGLGADSYQGFYYSKPVSADDFARLLDDETLVLEGGVSH